MAQNNTATDYLVIINRSPNQSILEHVYLKYDTILVCPPMAKQELLSEPVISDHSLF